MSGRLDAETFQPRLERYKKPYGAVTDHTEVELHIRPQRGLAVCSATLCARFEFDNNRVEQVPMTWVGTEQGRDDYTCLFSVGEYTGLVWYWFRLERENGQKLQTREYQLTVYDGSDRVPLWFGQGVCYQIFPDRFYRTRVPDPTGLVGDRTVHQSWEEEPIAGAVRQDEQGRDICNRDFFGGNLRGVEEKLDYISSLGVETIYFNPIFEAAENHRYGTADYEKIDPMLGNEEDFRHLCDEAHKRGIRVILDGVFNHTGYVSRYFNGDGFYPELGAAQSKDSPYYSWFQFNHWPDDYRSWWGIYSLPNVEEESPGYRDFIFGGENAVVRRWLRAGADGWRLDVADELPDEFVAHIHQAVRETKPDAVVIGEVWEDGTTKIAYDVRRRHLLGGHLDGLMNYPFRSALITYLLGGEANDFRETMETLRENYPPTAFYSAMNALGTHDTLRILTYLGLGETKEQASKEWKAHYNLNREELARGVRRLKLGTDVLFTFPGAPTVYYGDEVGMEGFEDPYNRRSYPWGYENQTLLAHYRTLGHLRKTTECLRTGSLRWGPCRGHVLSFYRLEEGDTVATAVNAGTAKEYVTLPWRWEAATDVLTGVRYSAKNGSVTLVLPGESGVVLRRS
jgi:glycosidase